MKNRKAGKRVNPGDTGFTLVEIMIAICILGVGLLAVANMQTNSVYSNSLSGNTTAALTLAEDMMEDLLGMDWNDANLSDTTFLNNFTNNVGQYLDTRLDSIRFTDHIQTNLDETGTVNGQAGGNFTRIWNIADNTPIANTKTICVIVTWGASNSEVGSAGRKTRNRKVCLCSTRGE